MSFIRKEKCRLFYIWFVVTITFLCLGMTFGKTAESFNIIITVDVDAYLGQRPFDTMVLGCLPGDKGDVGVPLIMELCEKHGVKATFFVDVFEYRIHGEERMADLVRGIVSRGHDVQLHTHPSWDLSHPANKACDQRTYSYSVHSPCKNWMKDYTLEEQITMLREGIEKLEAWTGERPVAHRAGGYGANYNTLAALAAVGITIDASMYWNHPRCQLNDPVLTRNRVVAYPAATGLVYEIPVTVFQYRREFGFGPMKYKFIKTWKVDIDGLSIERLKAAITALYESGVNQVILFLHDCTFVDPVNGWENVDSDKIRADTEDIAKFDELLAWIVSHPDWKVLTMKDMALLLSNNPEYLNCSDNVPVVTESVGYLDLWVIAVHSKEPIAAIFIMMHVLAIFVASLLGIRLMRKRKINIGDGPAGEAEYQS